MIIRRYRPGEEEELWQLYHGTVHQINARDYTREQCERWAPASIDLARWTDRVRSKNPFVAEAGGMIVGFAELEPDGHIDYFYCHHDWQGRGVGSALCRELEMEARRLGVTSLRAEVSVTAKSFFLGRGFRIMAEESNEVCGSPARRFLMAKKLSDGP